MSALIIDTRHPALSEAARDDARAAIAASTVRAYTAAARQLDAWLDGRSLDDRSLAAYIRHRHADRTAPASLGTIIAAVRFAARLQGLADPVGAETGLALARARREARGRGQVEGVTWPQADVAAMIAGDSGTLAGLRDAAIIALVSDALLRVCEAAALDIADLAVRPDGSGRLTIRHSKTDPTGEGAVLYLGAATVRRATAWLEAASIIDGAMFRRLRRGGRVTQDRLTDRSIRSIIARRSAEAGITGRISGHSLRVGSAQSLAQAGASIVDMQLAGRWQSPSMPARYARGQLAARGAVARLRHGT